mmetsp:Transcript_4120/g.3910  ORF Transcript_4120/g.3910 Transcript_4120/m.3910 type:complete len:198 (-) Transcript_4120:251-844(-)
MMIRLLSSIFVSIYFWVVSTQLLLLVVCNGQEVLTLKEFGSGLENGKFDAVVDVRTLLEWQSGHIEGATFVENLASTGNASLLKGCESCTIAVYCRTGARAEKAIKRLISQFGFEGATIYNALGVSQWVDGGKKLVKTESKPAGCHTIQDYVCKKKDDCGISCNDKNTISSAPSLKTRYSQVVIISMTALTPFLFFV